MKHPLTPILIVFFALALLYNWASPLFENSDEFFHFPLIHHLADNGLSLPVQSADNLQDWRQQGNQPPIYHLVAALLIMPFDTSDYPQARRLNPHAQIGIVGHSNINAVLHPLDRSAEWRGGTAAALRVVRVMSTLLAAVVVVAAYYLTRHTFPMLPRSVAALAAALVAFNPMFLFVASSVNNDNMSNALITAVLALLVWLYRRPALPPVRVLLFMGVLLGLSLLSKLSTGPFMLLVGVFWLALAFKHHAWGYMVKWGVVTLGLALLISGWWYWRNYDLYGDPTGLSMFLDIVGRRPIPLTANQLWSEREGFMQSFWGLYGGLTVPMAGWVYTGFNLLAGVSLVGVGVYVVGLSRPQAERGVSFFRLDNLPAIILPVWALLALVSVFRWTALTWATQGRLWFIAISALAALSALGFYELARRSKIPLIAWIPAGYALGIAIIAPFAWIRPAYAPPPLHAINAEAAPLVVFADPAATDGEIALTAASFPAEITAGKAADLHLELCTLDKPTRNWSIFAHLVNEWDIILAQADFTPGGGALPTAELDAGWCWDDAYQLRVPPGVVSADTPLRVLLGLYDHHTGERMVFAGFAGDEENRYLIAETRLLAGDELGKFTFQGFARLNSYVLSSPVMKNDETITLTLVWEVLKPFPADYTVFVQIIDPASAYRAAASDQTRPTQSWQVGAVIQDTHTLTPAPDAPAGVYAVLVGFYIQNADGAFQRLRLDYNGTDTGFDAMTLTQVRIEP